MWSSSSSECRSCPSSDRWLELIRMNAAQMRAEERLRELPDQLPCHTHLGLPRRPSRRGAITVRRSPLGSLPAQCDYASSDPQPHRLGHEARTGQSVATAWKGHWWRR